MSFSYSLRWDSNEWSFSVSHERLKMFKMMENCSEAQNIFMSILEIVQPWWKHLMFSSHKAV